MSLNLVLKSYHFNLDLNTSFKFFVKTLINHWLQELFYTLYLNIYFTHYPEKKRNIDSQHKALNMNYNQM